MYCIYSSQSVEKKKKKKEVAQGKNGYMREF